MNWSEMIPKNETFSKDTMRGKFQNPTKNIFNSFTFGKNPKVHPNSEGVVNPLFFFSFRLYEVQETNDSTTQVIIRRIHSGSKRNGF